MVLPLMLFLFLGMVEIGNALAGRLGAKAEHVWVTWDALIPALTSERCDIIVDGLFITEERKKQVAFSDPYYLAAMTHA